MNKEQRRAQADRKALGAYYTPSDLANYVAQWLIERSGERVLEPSFGGGSLIDAILDRFEEVGSGEVVGVEIDPDALSNARQRYSRGVKLLKADFLATAPEEIGPVDAVFANPPFTRNHALSAVNRKRFRELATDFGVAGAPGIWIYFLCHSLRFLRKGGRLAFVLPGAASFAHYAKPVLDALCSRFAKISIVHVIGQVVWDGDAQERAVLLLAEGHEIGSALTIDEYSLEKGDGIYERSKPQGPLPLLPHVELGQLAKIEIGCVTGSNRHFLLDEKIRSNLEIAKEDITPVVARARHLRGLSVDSSELYELARQGEKTLLLTPRDVDRCRAGVRAQLGKIPPSRRKKTLWFRKRQPWWRVQIGQTPDAIFTYMNHLGPRISLVSGDVAATNTLHKVHFRNKEDQHLRAISASMLTTYSQLHAENLGRIYGGGVLKFELADARRIPILVPEHLSMPIFKRIDTALRSNAFDKARELADNAILPFYCGKDWKEIRDGMDSHLRELRALRGIRKSTNTL